MEKKLGPIDLWVNNAMASVFSPIKEMKPEEFERVTQVTYLGYVYGTLSPPRLESMRFSVCSHRYTGPAMRFWSVSAPWSTSFVPVVVGALEQALRR